MHHSIAALPPDGRIPEAHRMLLDEATELMQKRIGCTVPEGSDPTVQPLRLTIDPVNFAHRPLCWYLFVKSANAFMRSRYELKYGLVYGKYKDLEWVASCMSLQRHENS